jgi:hypothetical protein
MKRFLLLFLLWPAMAFATNFAVIPGNANNGDGSSWANAASPGGAGAYNALPTTLVRGSGNFYYIANPNNVTQPAYNCNTADSGTTLITIIKATPANHGGLASWSDSMATNQVTWTNSGATASVITFTTDHWLFDGVTGATTALALQQGGSTGPGFAFLAGRPGSFDYVNYYPTGNTTDVTVRHTALGATSQDTAGNDEAIYVQNGGTTITYQYDYFWNLGKEMCIAVNFSGLTIDTCYGTDLAVTSSTVPNHGIIFELTGPSCASFTLKNSMIVDPFTSGDDITGWMMVYDYGGGGGSLAGADIYNNIFSQTVGHNTEHAGNGIFGMIASVSGTITTAHVYGNNFNNLDTANIIYVQNTQDATSDLFKNNISYACGTAGYQGSHFVYDTNAFKSGDTTIGTNQQTLSSTPFNNVTGLDFTLSAAGYALTTGVTLGSPYTTDIWGIARGSAVNGWSLGAFNGPPAAPTGITAGTTTTSSIPWTLTDHASGTASFLWQISSNGGSSYTSDGTSGTGVVTHTSIGLAAGTAYKEQAAATNTEGTSAYSTAGSGTTQGSVSTMAKQRRNPAALNSGN